MTGTAPFYAVYTADEGDGVSSYALVFARVDGDSGCPVLPRGADGATVTTSAVQFTACFTVPADQHAAREAFTHQRTSGNGTAAVVVFDSAGIQWCGLFQLPSSGRTTTCTLPDGPLTVVMEADAVDGTYQLTHQDATTPSG